MFWADKIAQELKSSGPQWVDDMKTPSGRIHVGALRGVIIHDLAYRALKEAGVEACFTYIFDSMDPMDALPVYLNQKKLQNYMGKPLYSIPYPSEDKATKVENKKGKESYAHFYAYNFQEVFNRLGANPEILWSHELYKSGKLNKQIKQALNNADKIQEIYEKVSGSKKRGLGWLPFQPICENCGKIGTTIALKWDGKEVTYKCSQDLVKWAKGCGHEGKISPLNGSGKLPWKVEWPAKWAALGVTVEGEGKDHASAGGSRDIANALLKEIFHYPSPYDIPYEFFLYGGRKMSSSKGVGATAGEVSQILPPELLRFLMVKVRPSQTLNFDPTGETIPKLFDEYDRAIKAFYSSTNPDLARIYQLSQINSDLPKEHPFVVRFSLIAQWVQMPNVNEHLEAEKLKGSHLNPEEKKDLEQRIIYANIWLERYASEDDKFSVKQDLPEKSKELTDGQKNLLREISQSLDKDWAPEDFQNQVYNWGKEKGLSSSETFEAIYYALLGKNHGPKASWLILSLDKEFVKRRFNEVNSKHEARSTKQI